MSKKFFQDIQHWAKHPFHHSNGLFYNLEIVITLDKKALQCLSGLGGGSFLTGYFCSYCAVRGSEKGANAWFACPRCALLGRPNCKHQPMLTSDDLHFAAELDLQDVLRNIILPQPKSSMRVEEARHYLGTVLGVNTVSNGTPLHKAKSKELYAAATAWWQSNYVHSGNIDTVSEDVVARQVHQRLRGGGGTLDRFCAVYGDQPPDAPPRELLRHLVYRADRLEAALEACSGTTADGAPINHSISAPEICVPCLLHMFMRMAEKLLCLLLQLGVQCRADTSAAEKDMILQRIQTCVNQLLSGLPEGAAADAHQGSVYRLPSVAPGQQIQISMSAARLKKVFAGRARLLQAALGDVRAPPGLLETFTQLFSDFHKMFLRLHSRKSFVTQDSINTMQDSMDDFCSKYIKAFGVQNITNYIHDLHAGHIHFFLTQYRSLYEHCNIAAEATMGTTTSFVHHGTQHGGHAGRNHSAHKHTVVQAMRSRMVAKSVLMLAELGEGDVSEYMQEMANSADEA